MNETFCIQCGRSTLLNKEGYCKDCELDHQVAAEEFEDVTFYYDPFEDDDTEDDYEDYE